MHLKTRKSNGGGGATTQVDILSQFPYEVQYPFSHGIGRQVRRTRSIAFTLAEVLITLGIIGVVAAITLPTVMTKVERNILKQQFKKTYSAYSQNLAKVTYELGGNYECYYGEDEEGNVNGKNGSSDCEVFHEAFVKNLKIIKKCEGNALAKGCLPKYSKYETSAGCSAFSENAFNVSRTVYVLNDGTLYIPYANWVGKFAVDINGKKGPNKPGYDLFAFNISRTPKGLYRFSPNDIYGCLALEDGYLTYEELFGLSK